MGHKAFLREFGARVRARRDELGKTQPELADAIDGLDQGGLSRLERGLQGFDSDTLFQVAAALDLPVYRLFGGVSPIARPEGVSPEALEIARQWERLTPSGRRRFTAAMILAMEHVPTERVEAAGFRKMGSKSKR